MKTNTLRRYCRRVGHYLICGKDHKKALLAGLAEELSERELSETLTIRDLYEAVGTPREMAAQLQSSVDAREARRVRTRRKCGWILCGLAFVLAVTLTCILWAKHLASIQPVYYKEYITYGDEPYFPDTIWVDSINTEAHKP